MDTLNLYLLQKEKKHTKIYRRQPLFYKETRF